MCIILNQNLTEAPQSQYTNQIIFSSLHKVCWVAIAAIGATVVASAFGALTLTGVTPFLLVGSSILLSIGASKCEALAEEYLFETTYAAALERKNSELAGWTSADIRDFLKSHQLKISSDAISALKLINETEPLKALIPVIARYNLLKNMVDEDFKEAKALTQNSALDTLLESQRVHARKIAWTILEELVLPNAFNAAVLLEIMQQPSAYNLTLRDIGTTLSKKPKERMLDLEFAKDPSTFKHPIFIFKDGRALYKEDFKNNPDPILIRKKLFDPKTSFFSRFW